MSNESSVAPFQFVPRTTFLGSAQPTMQGMLALAQVMSALSWWLLLSCLVHSIILYWSLYLPLGANRYKLLYKYG